MDAAPPERIEAGVKLAEAPAGRPNALSVTEVEAPLVMGADILKLPDEFQAIVIDEEFDEIEKSVEAYRCVTQLVE
jgi:hypothetical protein